MKCQKKLEKFTCGTSSGARCQPVTRTGSSDFPSPPRHTLTLPRISRIYRVSFLTV